MVKNDIKKQLIPGGIKWPLLQTIQKWYWQSKGLADHRGAKRENLFQIVSNAIILKIEQRAK